MKSALWLSSALALADLGSPAAPVASSAPHEVVVLVHGMGRTSLSMRPVETALERAGFEVLNYGYPSRRASVAESGLQLAEWLEREARRDDVTKVHLVGHSLGNIVIRWVAANRPPANLGRIVMLAPPNQGARLADRFSPWLSWLSEPLPDLTTAIDSTARTIPTPAGVEIGVIAGSRDFTVRVAETMLAGQKDHAVVRSGHTFIMWNRAALRKTIHFLENGSFQLEPPSNRQPAVLR